MISEKAKQVLKPLIGDNVEFLPLLRNSTSEVYYLVHVLNVLDAIDSDKAILKTDYRFNNRMRKIRI